MSNFFKYAIIICCACLNSSAYSQVKNVNQSLHTKNTLPKPTNYTGEQTDLKNNASHLETISQNTTQNVVYVQNRTINKDEIVSGDIVNVGYDVTSSIAYGNVLINSGASLRINSTTETIIKNGFECQLGATLIIE